MLPETALNSTRYEVHQILCLKILLHPPRDQLVKWPSQLSHVIPLFQSGDDDDNKENEDSDDDSDDDDVQVTIGDIKTQPTYEWVASSGRSDTHLMRQSKKGPFCNSNSNSLYSAVPL